MPFRRRWHSIAISLPKRRSSLTHRGEHMFYEVIEDAEIEEAAEYAESQGYGRCARCGRWAMEHLKTHSHCWECNYSPEESLGFRLWRGIEYRLSTFAVQRQAFNQPVLEERPGWLGIEHPYEHERHISQMSRGVL
jgi:hypothetical protein